MATGQVPLRLRIRWRLRDAARRWVVSTTIVLFSSIALAATGRVAISLLLQWRGSSEVARSVADDPRQANLDRINAMVAAGLDANATIEMLQRAASSPDPDLAIHGLNGLRSIREAAF